LPRTGLRRGSHGKSVEIEATIQRLHDNKKFKTDPIAGPKFSRIASVMGSASIRHGNIIERTLLEHLRRRSELTVWADREFQVSRNAEDIAGDALNNPASIDGNELSYCVGRKTVQVDLMVYHNEARTLRAYEVKRRFGSHDRRKRLQMLRDALCVQMLLKSYGRSRNLDPLSVSSHIIFYYDNCSVHPPIGIKGSELDEHFGFPVREAVETVNARFGELFRARLFSMIAAP
jgi:hypothetical protein